MTTARLTFRCTPRSFRAILDKLEVFGGEVEVILRSLGIFQFVEFPAFLQNIHLIIMLLSLWDEGREVFLIKGQELKFTADEVALMTGLPNRGEEISWESEPICAHSAIDIKREMISLESSAGTVVIVNKFIKFLLSNLLFPRNNYKTPRRLPEVARNFKKFPTYNWARAIRDCLVSQFTVVRRKIAQERSLGYMNGFVPLLLIWFLEHTTIVAPENNDARPRFLRWSSNIFWSVRKVDTIFGDLRDTQVLPAFLSITEEEAALLIHDPSVTHSSSPRPYLTIHNPHKSPSTSSSPPPSTHTDHSGRTHKRSHEVDRGSEISRPPPLTISDEVLEEMHTSFKSYVPSLDGLSVRMRRLKQKVGGTASLDDLSLQMGRLEQKVGGIEKSICDIQNILSVIFAKVASTEQLLLELVVGQKADEVQRPADTTTPPRTSTDHVDVSEAEPTAQLEESPKDSVEGNHQMKRSFPWEEAVTISLDDSSDSDSEEHKQDRTKRYKKDCSSEKLGDIMSEDTLIRMAGMYQDYMKRIPIPTFSGSVVPFTSWQGLAKSLKQVYGQPLHYLTNALLKQWDRERFGSDNETQPLDTLVHPLKAQTLIWLTEELHRLSVSPYYLAKSWASDPMYHSQIDPFLPC